MKIAFLTSCLEPGCDGVGDYTQLLAEECRRHGHEVSLIALNDGFVDSPVWKDGSIRFPREMGWSERCAQAREWLQKFSPDWVSLQFVCFGFEPRGLIARRSAELVDLLQDWQVQIFFHELWVGAERGASLKHRLLGWMQRRGVLSLVRRIEPRIVQTSNEAYVQLLNRGGVKAGCLPLFGSLPLPRMSGSADAASLHGVLFGTLHRVWPAEPLFTYLRRLKRRIRLTHIGRIGAGEALWAGLVRTYGAEIQFERLGELSPQDVADHFGQADFGVATTPWEIIGKSASVAAMIDCGLPVIVNRDDIHYPGIKVGSQHPLLIKMGPDLAEQLARVPRTIPRLRLFEMAECFLKEIRARAQR